MHQIGLMRAIRIFLVVTAAILVAAQVFSVMSDGGMAGEARAGSVERAPLPLARAAYMPEGRAGEPRDAREPSGSASALGRILATPEGAEDGAVGAVMFDGAPRGVVVAPPSEDAVLH